MSKTIKQLFKFAIVGVMNTLVTLVIIFISTRLFGIYYLVANVIGYIAGLINSFLWNRTWTFKSRGDYKGEILRFLIVFGICYSLQFGLLIFVKEYCGVSEDISQLIGMVFYTGLNFILNKFFTFRRSKHVS